MTDAIIGLWNFNDSGGSCDSSSSSSPPLDEDSPFEIPIPNKQPIKKIRNVRKSAIHKCAVCGDRPTGYHYDVLSCNGCKTFFRRTVINRRRFHCSRGGNCEFTKDFRCACRACRFMKCVAAGMNPKAIQFPTTNSVEKEENDSDDHEQDLSVAPLLKQIKTEEIDYMMALDTIIHREMAIQTFRGSKLPYSIYPDIPLEKLFERSCVIGSTSTENEPKSLPVEMYSANPVRYWMVADLFLAVEFAKTFTDFQNLSLQDKMELLYNVGGSIQILSQSYYSACQQAEALTFPDGINAMHYQVYKNNRRQHELYFRECYCRPVDIIRQLQLTMPEFVMLKTIALFSCESEMGEEAQKAISSKRDFLVTVFRKYLLAQYGSQRGAEKLAICLLSIATFIDIAEKRRAHLHIVDLMNKCQVSKLAKGIYLKQTIN